MHIQKAYRPYAKAGLEITEELSGRVLSLPIYCLLTDKTIEKICMAFARIFEHRAEIKASLKNE